MQLTFTVITYSHIFPPPHLIDYSPIIRRPFSRHLLLAFVVACCPFLSLFAARICRHLPPFFVILFCRPLLSSFAVHFCRPSRLLLLSIVIARRSHSSSFFDLRCRCLPIIAWQNMSPERSTVGGGIHRQKSAYLLPCPNRARTASHMMQQAGALSYNGSMWDLGGGRCMAVDTPAVATSPPYFSNQWKVHLPYYFKTNQAPPASHMMQYAGSSCSNGRRGEA